jgi:ketosteroid isomerase-like protein
MVATDRIVQEIEQFYKSYIDGFNREDIDLFLQSFDLPYVVLSGEHGATVCADEAARQRFYTQTMSGIQARGWSRSVTDKTKVWPLAENLATLMADVTRYKKDGSILERLRAFYTLRNDGKSWKIVTISMANPPFTGPGDIARG